MIWTMSLNFEQNMTAYYSLSYFPCCGCPLGNGSKNFIIIINYFHPYGHVSQSQNSDLYDLQVIMVCNPVSRVLLSSARSICMWIMVFSPNTCVSLTNFHLLFPFVLFHQLDNVSLYLKKTG